MTSGAESNKGLVLLVDDDTAVRRGVGALLAAANYGVSTFPSADDFLIKRDGVDLSNAAMLLDIYMPGIQGLELQKRLRQERVELPVIVMTAHGDVPMAVRAMRQGAVDFLEKPFTAEELMGALDRAFALPRPLHLAGSPQKVKTDYASLSQREREVFLAVVDGATSKEIARDLHVSPRTIEVHRRNIMSKMNAKSFAELVRMAGLIDLGQ